MLRQPLYIYENWMTDLDKDRYTHNALLLMIGKPQ